MKLYLSSLFAVFYLFASTQTFNGLNINLIGLLSPNTSTNPTPVGNKYSGCWGWYQQSKNKEYAISGASNGTYFIDVTNPATPTVSAFVQGKLGCTWREIKTYKNYCYVASDDGKPNFFQIIDMQYLPDSVHVINSSNSLLEKGHTLWVDSNKLYVGGITFSNTSSPMAIFSLATPSAPVLIKKLDDDISASVIDYVHDMYARNDTIYASAGNKGLFVLKHNLVSNSLTVIGSYQNYSNAGYNHSSFLTKNGKYLMFCDESPASLPIHMVDVQNLSNIQPLQSFYPKPHTTAHNPYMIGNNFAIVSCYQDGVYIYDISQPAAIKLSGYFDTFPQGGNNTGTYAPNDYNGNWGAYPYLPSGIIVANDMQNGVLLLNAKAAYTTTVKFDVNSVGIKTEAWTSKELLVYPNPASNVFSLIYNTTELSKVEIRNILNQQVYSKTFNGNINEAVDVSNYQNGVYIITLTNARQSSIKKLQVNH
jgi:choice-of-anchor B domain-containing protein